MNDKEQLPDVNRREFLKNTSLAAMMALMGGTEMRAEDAAKADANSPEALTKIPPPPPVSYGVIGLNDWGREILRTLSLLPAASVAAICDTYAHEFRKAKEIAPQAKTYEDYKQLLADPAVQAVIVATPTGTHRDIVLAALAAGKHVYCEAPLANSIEDARAIAKAAREAVKVVFQPGLQERSHPQRHFLVPFIRSGAMGRNVMARAQWHKSESWARQSPNAEREKELNWRLYQASSAGLLGEEGIHQIDIASWFWKSRPLAVTGFSSMILWQGDHDRDVPDTAQAVFEYPGGVRLMYDATLCSSFDAAYELYYGTDSTIMLRDEKAWLFKEVNAPLLGWEVYCRRDQFYTSTGIALVANGSKQTALTATAVSASPYEYAPLYYALEAFHNNTGLVAGVVKDFIDLYGDGDPKGLADALKAVKLPKPAATWQEGFEATVLALKANEAAVKKEKIVFQNEWFEL
jgi:predicted dehydrogenase